MLKALEIALDAQEMINDSDTNEDYDHPFVPEPEPVPEAVVPEEPEQPEETEEPENEAAVQEDTPEEKPHEKQIVPVKVKVRKSEPARPYFRVKVRTQNEGEEE